MYIETSDLLILSGFKSIALYTITIHTNCLKSSPEALMQTKEVQVLMQVYITCQ